MAKHWKEEGYILPKTIYNKYSFAAFRWTMNPPRIGGLMLGYLTKEKTPREYLLNQCKYIPTHIVDKYYPI
jgi:hypothetical protein